MEKLNSSIDFQLTRSYDLFGHKNKFDDTPFHITNSRVLEMGATLDAIQYSNANVDEEEILIGCIERKAQIEAHFIPPSPLASGSSRLAFQSFILLKAAGSFLVSSLCASWKTNQKNTENVQNGLTHPLLVETDNVKAKSVDSIDLSCTPGVWTGTE